MNKDESIISLVVLILVVAFLTCSPVAILVFLYKKKDILKDKASKLKYGSLYEGLRLYSYSTYTYYPIFLLRRLTFAFIMVYLDNWVTT